MVLIRVFPRPREDVAIFLIDVMEYMIGVIHLGAVLVYVNGHLAPVGPFQLGLECRINFDL